jgi:hypothetical protein
MSNLLQIYNVLKELSEQIGNGASVSAEIVNANSDLCCLVLKVNWSNSNFHFMDDFNYQDLQKPPTSFPDTMFVEMAIAAYEKHQRTEKQERWEAVRIQHIAIPPTHPDFEVPAEKYVSGGPTHYAIYEDEGYTWCKMWDRERMAIRCLSTGYLQKEALGSFTIATTWDYMWSLTMLAWEAQREVLKEVPIIKE